MLNSFIEWKQAHFFLHNSYLPEFFVSFFCLYKHCGLYFINIPSIFFSLFILRISMLYWAFIIQKSQATTFK